VAGVRRRIDNRLLLLLRHSVTIVYCCYGSLSERHSILYNCKRVLSLTEKVRVRLQFRNGTDGQAAEALQWPSDGSVVTDCGSSGSGVKQWH
jgi:hypothetical protein